MPMKPVVSIVILTWNRANYLELCLRSLFESLSPESTLSHEVIIMDNGSTDATDSILRKYSSIESVRIIRNRTNLGLNVYKRLFSMARGKYIIEVDDDVIQFPLSFDAKMIDYLNTFHDYGYLSLNVIQDDMTNGAKPSKDLYTDDVRDEKIVEEGPAGGWCAIFRRIHCLLLLPIFTFFNISMKLPEDALLQSYFKRIHKRVGIIKESLCLHACGPAYARHFNRLQREVEKYNIGGLPEFAKRFEKIPQKQTSGHLQGQG